jgi:hypothetical protein
MCLNRSRSFWGSTASLPFSSLRMNFTCSEHKISTVTVCIMWASCHLPLPLQITVVTMSTTCFNTLKLCTLPTQCVSVCIPYDSHNKQWLFPQTALTDWSLSWRCRVVFPVRYRLHFYILFRRASGFKRLIFSLFPVAPNLEHRASMKRFVSLQFLNPKTVGRTPWMVDQPVARLLPIQTQTNIYALSGIQTHDLSIRAGEDSSCLKPRGHCDQL